MKYSGTLPAIFLGLNMAGKYDPQGRLTEVIMAASDKINDIVSSYDFGGSLVPSTVPINKSLLKLVDEEEEPMPVPEDQKNIYQSVVGALLYVTTFARPDAAYAVAFLSRFTASPSQTHWQILVRTVGYLMHTKNMGLSITRGAEPDRLRVYCDADFASSSDSLSKARSTTGILIYCGVNLIMYCSRRQQSVAQSTFEAEAYAIKDAVVETSFLCQLLEEILVQVPKPIIVHEDNHGLVQMLHGNILKQRTKYIAVKLYLVQQEMESGFVRVVHCSTKHQHADVLTKPLPKIIFSDMRLRLNVL
jgi:hypothetical protein